MPSTLGGVRIARRATRAVVLLARAGRLPRPLRWLVAVGLLPLPGPLDEAALLAAAAIGAIFYRDRLREAWNAAETA